VERFFAATSEPSEVEWNAAVLRVRKEKISLQGMKRVEGAKWCIDVSDVPLAEKKAEVRPPENAASLSLVAANSSDNVTDEKVA
jgi:hypothetical protein